MHNVHFIVIRAESAEDAAASALAEIHNWGDEDNWRLVGGVVAENIEIPKNHDTNNTITSHDTQKTRDVLNAQDTSECIENHQNGRWGLSWLETLDGLQAQNTYFARALAYCHYLIQGSITLPWEPFTEVGEVKAAFATLCRCLLEFDLEQGDTHALWAICQNLEYLRQIIDARRQMAQGVELPEFYSWQMDKTGLTDMTGSTTGAKRYLVLLDMHS
jgi:hypothetical protein